MISLYHSHQICMEGFSESLSFDARIPEHRRQDRRPGGVTTSFTQRSGQEFRAERPLPDYDAFGSGRQMRPLHDAALYTSIDDARGCTGHLRCRNRRPLNGFAMW